MGKQAHFISVYAGAFENARSNLTCKLFCIFKPVTNKSRILSPTVSLTNRYLLQY